jgi:hypothetical protein
LSHVLGLARHSDSDLPRPAAFRDRALDILVGLIKAPFFAAIIALVGCYEGFNVARSADGVGRLTTQSVVEAIFWSSSPTPLFRSCSRF